MTRNKIATAIATFLVLTMIFTLAALPVANAQKTEATAYLSFRPNPIGVNQSLLINAWVSPPPVIDWSDMSSIPRTGYLVSIVDPDGNIDTVGPLESYVDGTIWFNYTPDKIGNWTIQFKWPGDEYFTACETQKQPLIVQNDPIPSWPAAPLPTEPWTWPINPENREWSQISGLWSGIGYNASAPNYNPYSQAPSSSHILWKLPSAEGQGGLIGGTYGSAGWYAGNAASIDAVMAGRGYYQSGGVIHCVNIRTGEELWTTAGSFTQAIIDARVPVYWEGQVSGYTIAPTLINTDSRLIKYDGLTGEIVLNVTGIAGMHMIDYPNVYTYDGQNQCLVGWSCLGDTEDFSQRMLWNVSIPWNVIWFNVYGDIIASVLPGEWGGAGAINATTGEELWSSMELPFIMENPNPAMAYGKIFFPTYDRQYVAVDIKTGKTAWLSEKADYPWGDFWAYGTAAAYDMIYGAGYDGVYAFDQGNGSIVWHFRTATSGFEAPSTTWSFFATPLVADGKIYAATGVHPSALPPYSRGQKMYCVNASNGDPMWSIMGYYNPTAIGEGTLFATNSYDSCSYAFAKGETATTVSTSPEIAGEGSSVLIKGTVMDMSPAQANTPAISDASMSGWMEYLHMQQPLPADVKGVQVTLSVIDSNGNHRNIGIATSDAKGFFSYMWTPDIPGKYTVIATFAGSESYYSSSAETAFGVEEPISATTPEPTQAPVSTADQYFLPMTIGIIASIAVVGALMLLQLRKK
jgi:PQQ-like domain